MEELKEAKELKEANNEYTFSYIFGGRKWSTSVWASSPEEAKRKIRAQAGAVYDGEIKTKIYIPVNASLVKRISAWWIKIKNKFR